jgi:AcrR family transcriptional regulator
MVSPVRARRTASKKPSVATTSRQPRRRSREQQKQQRFARIKLVARELFLRNGYEGTTLREIGRKARVGAGTILRYVPDKRELLFLLFDEDHKRVSEAATAELSEAKSFLDQSIDGFRHYYQYFRAYPDYARAILREASFYNPLLVGGASAKAAGTRSIQRIKRTIETARKRGEITIDESDDVLARFVFEIYQIECRHWLAARNPDVAKGLAELRRALGILQRGFRS